MTAGVASHATSTMQNSARRARMEYAMEMNMENLSNKEEATRKRQQGRGNKEEATRNI